MFRHGNEDVRRLAQSSRTANRPFTSIPLARLLAWTRAWAAQKAKLNSTASQRRPRDEKADTPIMYLAAAVKNMHSL